MPRPTTSIKLKGPLFTPSDILGTETNPLQAAVNRGLTDLAQFEGANRVKEQLTPGHGRKSGKLRGQIFAGLLDDNLAQFDAGETQHGRNLIYSGWVEGIDKRNKTSVFKGYGMFKEAHAHIDNNQALYDKYIGDAILEALDK
jgi:hypothetical protein